MIKFPTEQLTWSTQQKNLIDEIEEHIIHPTKEFHKLISRDFYFIENNIIPLTKEFHVTVFNRSGKNNLGQTVDPESYHRQEKKTIGVLIMHKLNFESSHGMVGSVHYNYSAFINHSIKEIVWIGISMIKSIHQNQSPGLFCFHNFY